MSEAVEPFWGWPGWKHLRYALLLSLAGSVWFTLVYGGADVLTAHRVFRVRVHFDAELGIPFVPEMAVVYMSIYLLFLAAPFILRRKHEFLALAMTLNLVILVAGICFLLLPAQLAYPPPENFGAFPNLYHFADRLSLNYNPDALTACCLECGLHHGFRGPERKPWQDLAVDVGSRYFCFHAFHPQASCSRYSCRVCPRIGRVQVCVFTNSARGSKLFAILKNNGCPRACFQNPFTFTERSSVSRSSAQNSSRPVFSHVLWLAELLRVTDPRSDRNLKTRPNEFCHLMRQIQGVL